MLEIITEQLIGGIAGLFIGFILGNLSGFFLCKIMDTKHVPGTSGLSKSKKARNTAIMIVNTIIVLLWSASVANGIFQFNDAKTPIFLHAMMGAVMGYLNEGFGKYLMEFFGRAKRKANE